MSRQVDDSRVAIDAIYRRESGRVLATLIRLLNGNFDLAEEALHDAFAAALDQWSRDGIPEKPRAWLVSTGRFKAIDRLRRMARFDALQDNVAAELELASTQPDIEDSDDIEDDRLRLIFTCCHPALTVEAQLALTLREVCGLTTEAVAAAFLLSPPTLAQRIVRAKNKIRDEAIPYEVPEPSAMPDRLDAVLKVIYLVFNEAYSASSGKVLIDLDLAAEAIRLARILLDLLPEAEVMGLLALMIFHHARRAARLSAEGDLILLDQQDRSLWDRSAIAEGSQLVTRALKSRRFGAYSLQAAIAALHAEAPSAEETDWAEIVGLYEVLMRVSPSPVVELNRAVALAMRDGPAAGIARVEALFDRGELRNYHLAHAALADLYRRLGDTPTAIAAYERALALTRQEPERRFLHGRLAELRHADKKI